MRPGLAELIARTRAVLDGQVTDFGNPLDWAERCGALEHLAGELCIELENATDPDGAHARSMARLRAMGARADALAQ